MDTQDRAKPTPAKEEPIATLDDVAKPLDSFGRIIFLIIVVEIVVMFGLKIFQESRIKSLNEQLTERKNELKTPEFSTLNNQVEEVLAGSAKLTEVLASKVKWEVFYSRLNSLTPKNVVLTSINISDGGTFKADGETASLSSLAEALVAWQKGTDSITTPFSSVTLVNNGYIGSGNARRVSFSISGSIDLGRIQ